jgi:hypothetical protein
MADDKETELRDEFAKIAFKTILEHKAKFSSVFDLGDNMIQASYTAYSCANNMIRARRKAWSVD